MTPGSICVLGGSGFVGTHLCAALARDDGERIAEAGLTALPGSSFVVRGAEPGKDAKILAAAVRYDFAGGLSLGAGAEGRWSDGRDLVAATVTARYAW